MPLFRLYQSGEPTAVGVIVAKNKAVADAFAQGSTGARSSAERVAWKAALESGQVCEVISTGIRRQRLASMRVIV